MNVSMGQLVNDAKELVIRLKEREKSVDQVVIQSNALSKKVDSIQQLENELMGINEKASHRSKVAVLSSIQKENKVIKLLQQENEELKESLEEHQSVLEIIMSKYRQQMLQLIRLKKQQELSETYYQSVLFKNLQEKTDQIAEMTEVMKHAIEIDDKTVNANEERLQSLLVENRGLKDMLKIRSKYGLAEVPNTSTKEVQTNDINDINETNEILHKSTQSISKETIHISTQSILTETVHISTQSNLEQETSLTNEKISEDNLELDNKIPNDQESSPEKLNEGQTETEKVIKEVIQTNDLDTINDNKDDSSLENQAETDNLAAEPLDTEEISIETDEPKTVISIEELETSNSSIPKVQSDLQEEKENIPEIDMLKDEGISSMEPVEALTIETKVKKPLETQEIDYQTEIRIEKSPKQQIEVVINDSERLE